MKKTISKNTAKKRISREEFNFPEVHKEPEIENIVENDIEEENRDYLKSELKSYGCISAL